MKANVGDRVYLTGYNFRRGEPIILGGIVKFKLSNEDGTSYDIIADEIVANKTKDGIPNMRICLKTIRAWVGDYTTGPEDDIFTSLEAAENSLK